MSIIKTDDRAHGFMPVYDIPGESRVVIDGVEYSYNRRLPDGHSLARVDDLAVTEIFTHGQMASLIADARIKIDEGFFTRAKAELRLTYGRRTFAELTEAQARKVRFKEDWCRRFIAAESEDRRVRRSDAKMEIAIADVAADMMRDRRKSAEWRKARGGKALTAEMRDPTPTQLRRWLKRYERSGYERDSLIDQYFGPGSRLTLDADTYAMHHDYAVRYASNTRPTKAALFLLLQGAIDDEDAARAAAGRPPMRRLKRKAFERMIDALDPFFVCAGREGREAALRKWGMHTTGLDVESPFERIELDEWRVSLMKILVDAGLWEKLSKEQKAMVERSRVWLSAAIDARTRMIVAMRLLDTAPCVESALATIETAMVDKSRLSRHLGTSPTYIHAKPRSVAMDNGTNLTSDAVLERLSTLGIAAVYPPAGLAEMRGRIERIFLTLRTRILSHFPGQTFANVVDRGDYDAEGNACLDIDELNAVFLKGVLDLYHNHPHEGLTGETPWNCMRRLSRERGLPPPPHRDVLRHVMGVACERRIGVHGVSFSGIRYQSEALQRYRREIRQRPAEVRVDPLDLWAVSVKTKTGWITVPARFRGLEGVSIWQWAEAVRDLRQRHADSAALSRGTVLAAVTHLSDVAQEAVRRAEIRSPVLTAKYFEKLEADVFRSLTFADDGEFGDDLVLPSPLVEAGPILDLTPERIATNDEPADGLDESVFDDASFGSPEDWSSN